MTKAALFDFGGVVANVRMALAGDAGDSPYIADYNHEVLAGITALRNAGVKTALVTNNDRQLFDEHFRTAALTEAFDVETFSSDVGRGKPDRAIYTAALSALGVNAEDAIFFDDLARNVDAAAQLGIESVLVHHPGVAIDTINRLLGAVS